MARVIVNLKGVTIPHMYTRGYLKRHIIVSCCVFGAYVASYDYRAKSFGETHTMMDDHRNAVITQSTNPRHSKRSIALPSNTGWNKHSLNYNCYLASFSSTLFISDFFRTRLKSERKQNSHMYGFSFSSLQFIISSVLLGRQRTTATSTPYQSAQDLTFR